MPKVMRIINNIVNMIRTARRIGLLNIIKATVKAIRILGFRRVMIANIESYKVSKALASAGWTPEDIMDIAMMAGMAAANGERTIMVFGGPGGLMQRTIIDGKVDGHVEGD